MARRGTVKRQSIDHEDFIACNYLGYRQASSGAVAGDEGDVRTPKYLIECKTTGSPAKPLKSKPVMVDRMEKIAAEAYMDDREPALALRFYWPDSTLADRDGYVDLIVRRVADDIARI